MKGRALGLVIAQQKTAWRPNGDTVASAAMKVVSSRTIQFLLQANWSIFTRQRTTLGKNARVQRCLTGWVCVQVLGRNGRDFRKT